MDECQLYSSLLELKHPWNVEKVSPNRILNYFTHHITNAMAEEINSKIALIEKMYYGYRNKDH